MSDTKYYVCIRVDVEDAIINALTRFKEYVNEEGSADIEMLPQLIEEELERSAPVYAATTLEALDGLPIEVEPQYDPTLN